MRNQLLYTLDEAGRHCTRLRRFQRQISLALSVILSLACAAPLRADSPQITSVSPDSGIPGTQVTIKANVSLAKATDVVFGGEKAKTFSVQSDGSLVTLVPSAAFKVTTSVPVTVILDGKMLPTNSKFTIPIAEVNVSVPQPQATGSGPEEQADPWWQAGNGRSLTLGPGSQCDGLCPSNATILFSAQPVSFYVATSVGNTGTGTFFNAGNFAIGVDMCDVGNDAAKLKTDGKSGPFTTCKNWDGYDGVWIPIDGKCKQTTLPQVFVFQWTSQQTGNYLTAGSSGKLSADVSACFDDQNLVRTFQYVVELAPATISKVEPKTEPGRTDTETSPPFNVALAPSAMFQTNAIPYTILYQPPGDMSSVSFSTSDTYMTQFSVSNSKSVDNKTTTSKTSSMNFAESVAFMLGFTGGDTDAETDTTMQDFGTAQGAGLQGSTSAEFSAQLTAAAVAGEVPGNGLVCNQSGSVVCSSTTQTPNLYALEPFWDDEFVLIVKPQFVVWVIGGSADRYQMYGAAPALAEVGVGVLDACATGQTVNFGVLNPCEVQYSTADMTASNKTSDVVSKGQSGSVTLTKDEARGLLALDPFYQSGQDAEIDATRANQVASPAYGASAIESDVSYTNSFSNNTQLELSQNASVSYTTDITKMYADTTSAGLTMGMPNGASGGGGGGGGGGGSATPTVSSTLTIQSSDQTSYENDLQLTYQNSTAVSKDVVTTAQVTLNDEANCSATTTTNCHGPLAARPSVNIFFDRVFGSFMFQDPAAPKDYSRSKVPVCCIVLVNSLLAQETSKPRFSDVPKTDPNVGAIGVLALTQVLPGNADGTFKPNDPFTRQQLAVAIAQAAHLPKAAANVKFGDIADGDPNLNLIEAATAAKAVMPRSAVEFGASDPVTRADLSTALSAAGLSSAVAGGSSTNTSQLTRAEAAMAIFAVLRNRQ
jgi:hypothetical protein